MYWYGICNVSLENITTTSQSGNSHTTTTTSLDGGVTLNATTEVQNCEHSSSQWRCGNDYPGRDSYSTTIKILDENDNVLASTSITRNAMTLIIVILTHIQIR